MEVFDARPLSLARDHFPAGHLGLHPRFAAAYFMEPANRLWRYKRYVELLALSQSMDAISSDLNDGILALLSFCHKGKHRSVFLYTLLGGILSSLGWKVQEHALCYFAQTKSLVPKATSEVRVVPARRPAHGRLKLDRVGRVYGSGERR